MFRLVSVRRSFSVLSLLLITSCTLSRDWDPSERTGLNPVSKASAIDKTSPVEKLISVPLNPEKPEEGSFDLYYFVRIPDDGKLGNKTVLFCAGGPGEIIQRGSNDAEDNFADFLRSNGYNVVYFHLRGSGFSQIPQSSKFDKFLRTLYAVEDIERIRQDFLGDKKWDAIIGWSYGTVLAQQYAASRYQDKVGKLILIAALSEHKDDFSRDDHAVRRESLEKIYEMNDVFENIRKTGEDRKIIHATFGPKTKDGPNEANNGGVIKKIVDAFGSEQYVVDEYCKLKETGELAEYGLGNYSRNFFRKLREIRLVGWSPETKDRQVEIGKAIAVEVNPALKLELGDPDGDDNCNEQQHTQGSQRLLYMMRSNDGFLSRIRGYLKARVNRFRERLGLGIDTTERWDPAQEKFRHSVQTLILKGGADPVIAGGQAERYYTHALRGPRTFMEFPGVGHELHLPKVPIDIPFLSGTVRFPSREIPAGIHRLFGKADGLNLMRQTRLIPPDALMSHIEIVNSKIEPGNLLTVMILNKSTTPVPGQSKDWNINSPFFTAIVRFPPQKEIPAHGMVSWVGKVIDIKIYEQIEVVPPEDWKSKIELISAYFPREKEGLPIESANRVSLMIRNKGENPLPTPPAGERNWRIGNPFFVGTLRFATQEAIPGDGTRVWVAEIIDVKVHKDIELVPPENLASQLEVVSVSLDPEKENHLVVMIKNTGDDPVPVVTRNWIVRSPFYTAIVRLEPEKIPGRKTVKITGTVQNAKIKPQSQFLVTPPPLETGLKYFGESSISGENTLSVLVTNTTDHPVLGEARNWTIASSFLRSTILLEPKEVPQKRTVNVTGRVADPNIQLNMSIDKERITLIPPSHLGYEFISGSEHIESANRISILVWNKGTTPLRVRERDWIYIAPNRETSCQGSVSSRDCLIYAFIEMEFSDFSNPQKNRMFEAIQEKFDNTVTIKHCNEGGPDICNLAN